MRPMRPLCLTTVLFMLAVLICGCGALRSPDAATVTICKRGFAKNEDWTRASRFREMLECFASCSRDRCEDRRCLWLVRLFDKIDGQWVLSNHYHLGVPNTL
jgi:hypothetical protein